jgi:phage tail sheath protein FI
MGFQVSPGVNVSEVDLTTIVPAVSTTTGAIAGVFRWGPIGQAVLVDAETTLVRRFGEPTNYNAETFFTAANFLAYGNQLYVSRAANTTDMTSNGCWTAVANTAAYTTNAIFNIPNQDVYNTSLANGSFTNQTGVLFIAKYPGSIGSSLAISLVDNANQYSSNVTNVSTTSFTLGTNTATLTFDDSGYVRANAAYQALTVGDFLTLGNSTVGYQTLQLASKGATTPSTNSLTLSFYSNYSLSVPVSMSGNINRLWQFYNSVTTAPGVSNYNQAFGNSAATDEVHIIVYDENGQFTGTPGQVLEVWQGLSRGTDAQNLDGSTNFFQTVINQNSQYVWFTNNRGGATYTNTCINLATPSSTSLPLTLSFIGGQDGTDETQTPNHAGAMANALSQFVSSENINISLLLAGKAPDVQPTQFAQFIIDNIVNVRKDCVAFISPPRSAVVSNVGNELSAITTFQQNLSRSTSYAVMDSGYKYQYDKYNDIYRYVPLNGDIAGLCVYTDNVADPWWSPAGFNRGQIKNVVKLAYNPKKADRDVLYPAGINPVVTFPGQGTYLYGDKTLQTKSSAFDRINVRRLFIVLEKAISLASQFSLFEFNDAFTQAQFVSLVTPYLKDIQGRRGIYDFRVVCDGTNNTPQVVDANQFVGDIYIKPARSINFIQLNFVAVRTGVDFSEIVGNFG